jgi:methylthioribose-1-phosphate isomerase
MRNNIPLRAITTMAIRGAPAIGIAAAMGIALAAKKSKTLDPWVFRNKVEKVCEQLSRTRPTAVNLVWAVNRMRMVLNQVHPAGTEGLKKKLEEEALRIYEEDLAANQKSANGKALI